ncbi:MAG: porin family protein [Ferruginibacter sp.]
MQDVANDMDDLFQRAAENYPLDAGKGDWEAVLGKISEDPESPVVIAVAPKKRNKNFIAAALLLCCLFAGLLIKDGTHTEPGYGKKALTENQLPITVTDNKNAEFQNEISTTKPAIIHKTHPAISNNQPSTLSNYKIELVVTGSDNSSIDVANYNNSEPFVKKLIAGSIIPDYSYTMLMKKHKAVTIIVDDSKAKNIATQQITTNKKENAESVESNTKGLYAGLVGGPEFSKGNDMAYNNSGLSAGVLLGYRLNKKISLESGLLWNNKKYASQGKNFNMKKVAATMPSGMIINNLASNISLLEIPLKIKYDVYNKHNATLFLSAGVSAYVMTKEENNYNVTLNGANQQMTGVYKKNSYELPAVVNISLGYQKNVSKNFDIRLEPFLKIPIQGIGVGNLPVTSAGLQVGIIHRLK